ncbi:GNAT family N-acetyltransferase [Spelaeicoccus albus]|uniref:GNAT superfamily N-acetyltransferase n=1 Tax=Spelaeicoccus albus TaxID=1280376 RepID=A0A7Z0II93_9MICO|nr:GNAT family N-acetyltransferase [Spelaeicoccus albus]NYI68152.1 GNAT superfamily N-acetyltransferase [Spelaeicoccus albus]
MTDSLTWRALTVADAPALLSLLKRVEVYDADQERITDDELRRSLAMPWIDLTRDSLVGLDRDGNPVAGGLVTSRPGAKTRVRIQLMGCVAPEYRNRGLGRRLLEWQLDRGRGKLAEIRAGSPHAASLPAALSCYAMAAQTDKAQLYRHAGLTPVRYFASMRRRVRDEPCSSALPAGVTLEPWTDGLSEEVRTVHNEVFADHWGSQPHDRASWRKGFIDGEAFRPELSVVAVGPDGTVIGYALNSEYVQDWEEQGYSEGYTDLLGVVAQWRGKGVASALLAETARLCVRRGHPYVALDVDTASPTGADRLYASMGYAPTHTSVCFELDPD